MKKPKVLLLNPPLADVTMPLSGLPSLAAFLRQQGVHVIQRDVNIQLFDAMLTKARLKKACETIFYRVAKLERYRVLPQKSEKKLLYLKDAVKQHSYVINNIEKAKDFLRDPAHFYNYKKYLLARLIISKGLEIISGEYYPTTISLEDCTIKIKRAPSLVASVASAVRNNKENIFLEYFENEMIPFILAEQPDIVGISIVYFSQIIPAFTLAYLLRNKNKKIHITVGGTAASWLAGDLNKKLFSFIDSLIINEGEHALLELTRRIERNEDLTGVPNCIYLKSQKIHKDVKYFFEDIDSLPAPDFDGLPLHLYFSPKRVLPLAVTRGCYWNKCAFCTYGHSDNTRCNYREKNVDLIIRDILELKRKYKTEHLFFTVDVASPPFIGAFIKHPLKKID